VGNGQYYDPATGRFLTRDVNPNSTNPYMPFNPIGVIVGPLGLLSLFYTRKKKGSKTGTFLVLLIVLGGVGVTLAACQTTESGYDITITASPTQPNSYNVTATPTTTPSSTPSPTDTPLPTITATCTLTPTSFPNLEPWKQDEGYDSGRNAILNWGAPADDEGSRRNRAHKVWEWMRSVPGWWNNYTSGYPSVRDLSAWLLEREGGSLLNGNTIAANPNGSWRTGIRIMAGLMGAHFTDGITDVDLSTYTAFFNPKWDSVFDDQDWAAINRSPSNFMYDYIDEYLYSGVYIHTDTQGNQYRVARWWDDLTDKASGYCSNCISVVSVRIPNESKTLFFGYNPNYDSK
jgi:hypothetical protein